MIFAVLNYNKLIPLWEKEKNKLLKRVKPLRTNLLPLHNYFNPDTMSSGLTHWSNSADVKYPNFSAASFKVSSSL